MDLADEKGMLCGKLLGDLGADVIKIEPPGGDPARNIGPFYKDIPHPEKSLFWFYTNMHKRSITLNLETPDGQAIFKKLVETADFVIESFEPGYMDSLGLGYAELERINPGIVMTSITPFGQTGPYAHYKASDLVGVAMGGMVRIFGEFDRPPNRISAPQFYYLGGLHGAVGSMVAYYHRELTGEGQHVDVSCQQAVVLSLMIVTEIWDMLKVNFRGMGPNLASAARPGVLLLVRMVYPCKDGHIFFVLGGGAQAALVNSARALTELANRHGMALELKGYAWEKMDSSTITPEEMDRAANAFYTFFQTMTKAELFREALDKNILLAPITTIEDVAESPQFKARGFWEDVEHPELGATITYPGYPIKMNETPYKVQRRAPLVGEHNEEIYKQELGYSTEQMAILKSHGVI
jgi:crotonobetainyl-CoA:carnitine CoA-transferase CaiB-like acyl-CoA transferase